MPEFRKDPVIDRWVIIAPERAKRPQNTRTSRVATAVTPCAFCAGNESMTPPESMTYRAPGADPDVRRWVIRVVPNKYPAVVDESAIAGTTGLYQRMTAVGIHEVIIEAPEHVTRTTRLSEAELADVIHVYRDRAAALQTDGRWRYLLIYKNEGAEAGATFDHIHSQAIALPMVPREAAAEVDGARRYYQAEGRCLYCDILRQELEGKSRLIAAGQGFVVLAPFASRFPYECWIVPMAHSANFAPGSKDEDIDLARCLRQTLTRLDRVLEQPSFNYYIHSDHFDGGESHFFHWHIEIVPKLVQVAGFEWGSGSYINPVAPEEAARRLREVAL